MILKWLIVGAVIWFFYNRFKRNTYLEERRKEEFRLKNEAGRQSKESVNADNDEYIDYEEVE
ncbi:hypothetical protein [Membranihabitans marinus]|uniref:hypothetical protein n=1 Tax=Membranihabitans marinus TaxID=1227546 RepID=UPI001F2A9993|nr:hypothetical protein [Membranihabitans marinus]